ncbi:glyoxylate/hydroxypyruvate reductase A [Arenibacter sp. 6A1]|uniref:2-hydroxyacid dehydrogenase n=1 Tax=Arenibacter sp. 6A1 TaxID=2720391 RepID=UPI001446F9BD|nr:glyoxylate/hydroxypyruvate reductase A [Arenibacter sp. 6A1]NKI24981.1 glyoxylate/hydroxypyruvate reductase A [Arenibacter sp. 6A1]
MSIVIIRQDGKINEWIASLKKNNTDIEVYSYLEAHPKDKITMAIVWKHPSGSLLEYPNLKCVASFGAGVDFIFDDPGFPSGVAVTRVVDPILASDMSEFIIANIFNFLKNLTDYKAAQISEDWNRKTYKRIADVSVGIMGMGALGSLAAINLKQYGFRVHGWANSPKPHHEVRTYVGQTELQPFLSATDILVCLLPLTEDTNGILNKELFKDLPQGAYVINVARGGHLVDEDLLEMLDNDHLAGASLDVFHQEPLPKDHPFWRHPKILVTPHTASVSDMDSVVPQLLENYNRLQKGAFLNNIVSEEKGY